MNKVPSHNKKKKKSDAINTTMEIAFSNYKTWQRTSDSKNELGTEDLDHNI